MIFYQFVFLKTQIYTEIIQIYRDQGYSKIKEWPILVTILEKLLTSLQLNG